MALTAIQQVEARRRTVTAIFAGAAVTATKAEIDAAVNACVSWAEANTASAVAAMSGTILAGQPAAVKATVLAIAIDERYAP